MSQLSSGESASGLPTQANICLLQHWNLILETNLVETMAWSWMESTLALSYSSASTNWSAITELPLIRYVSSLLFWAGTPITSNGVTSPQEPLRHAPNFGQTSNTQASEAKPFNPHSIKWITSPWCTILSDQMLDMATAIIRLLLSQFLHLNY